MKIIWSCITSYDSDGKERNLLWLMYLLAIYLPDGIHHSFDKDCRSKDSKGNKLKEKLMLHELEPLMLKALKDLVLWSMIVLLTIMVDSTSTNSSADKEKHDTQIL